MLTVDRRIAWSERCDISNNKVGLSYSGWTVDGALKNAIRNRSLYCVSASGRSVIRCSW